MSRDVGPCEAIAVGREDLQEEVTLETLDLRA